MTTAKCSDCGVTIANAYGDSPEYVGSNDKIVCRNCFRWNYAKCNECRNFRRIKDVDRNHVCRYCKNRKCRICDTRQTETDEKFITVEDTKFGRKKDYYEIKVCKSCFLEHYITCEDCDKYFPKDDIMFVGPSENTRIVCPECFDDDYSRCDSCNDLYLNDYVGQNVHWNGEEKSICENCLSESQRVCDNCGEDVDAFDHYFKDGEIAICILCLEEVICPQCRKRRKGLITDFCDDCQKAAGQLELPNV